MKPEKVRDFIPDLCRSWKNWTKFMPELLDRF
jgi:hypothetical protein